VSNLTYKYRLKGKRAARQLRRYAWAANQVWNFCVETQKNTQRRWKHGSSAKWKTHFDLTELTKGASKEFHDRDVNAAKNILTLGLSAQPRVDESRDPSEKKVA
jgi:transposase